MEISLSKRPKGEEMETLKKIRQVLFLLLELTGGVERKTTIGEIMYIVKDDNPEVGFELSYEAFDAEGNEVPEDTLVVEVTSDNEAAVSVVQDGNGGTISFGSPGLANLNAVVSDASGKMLGSFGAQFTVTVGDPASISGGELTFDGLTEA